MASNLEKPIFKFISIKRLIQTLWLICDKGRHGDYPTTKLKGGGQYLTKKVKWPLLSFGWKYCEFILGCTFSQLSLE
jgi:hypothetical protein